MTSPPATPFFAITPPYRAHTHPLLTPPLQSLVVPSTRVVPFKGSELQSGPRSFVASSATVVGDVHMGEQASVWYGAVVRGALRRLQ